MESVYHINMIYCFFFLFFGIFVARIFCRIIKREINTLPARNVMRHELHVGERSRILARMSGAREKWKETVTSAHVTHRGVYLHAKVHFIQVYNYGFPSRQVPVPEDSRLGSGFRNALATFLPTFPSFQPHQPVQPFGRVRFPSPSLHLITLRPTEYTPSYETLYVEHAIDG